MVAVSRSLRRPALLMMIAVAAFAAGSILKVYGTGAPATFFGCLTTGGTLIDVATSPASAPVCPAGSQAVTWNQPTGGGGGLSGVSEFTANGSFVTPPGVTHVMVEAWGGGGGGGAESDCASGGAGGGGGGSGGYVRGVVTVTPGQAYDVIVGSGGAASASGGASRFSSQGTPLISAGGGNGATLSTGGTGGLGNPAGGILRAGAQGANGSPSPGMCPFFFGSSAGGTAVQGSVAIPNRSAGCDGASSFNSNTPQAGAPGDVILTW